MNESSDLLANINRGDHHISIMAILMQLQGLQQIIRQQEFKSWQPLFTL